MYQGAIWLNGAQVRALAMIADSRRLGPYSKFHVEQVYGGPMYVSSRARDTIGCPRWLYRVTKRGLITQLDPRTA